VPRRRPGTLLPLEIEILAACVAAGDGGIHGFAIAKVIAEAGDDRPLTATGTLYRALHRLGETGLVESWWETPGDAAAEGRPQRRCYRVTAAGVTALASSRPADAPVATHQNIVPEVAP
jgi:PadR family transcriptional regulator PadR